MSDLVFVDTNVLVYAVDSSEPRKQPAARDWLRYLWETRCGRTSFQVLDEYYWVVTGKLKPGRTRDRARSDVRDLMAWRPIAIGGDVLERAWSAQDRFQLSFWDALVVAAARASGCRYLLTEDLQAGQNLDGLQIVDPFAGRPPPASRPA